MNENINKEYIQTLSNSLKQNIIICTDDKAQQEYIERLFSEKIDIIPKPIAHNIVRINLRPHNQQSINGISRRIKNIHINLKEAVITGIEMALTIDSPGTSVDLIKALILVVIKLMMLTKVELLNSSCVLLLYLHNHDAYNVPKLEEEVLADIDKGILKISKEDYYLALKQLEDISSLVIVDGKIELTETIILGY